MSRSPDSERLDRIQVLLGDIAAEGLLVVASSGSDPDIGTFAGPVHLGECVVVLPTGGEPRLAFATDMERDEAARSGLALISPSRLLGSDPTTGNGSPGGRAHRIWRAALRRCGVDGGRVALAGSYPAGPAAEAFAALERDGFEMVDFSQQMRLVRKAKTAAERREITRVAEATCRAMRAVAKTLAAAQQNGSGGLELNGRPLTAGDLRAVIRSELTPAGLAEPEGNIVSAAADAAVPHTQGSDDRELAAGETIVVDLYPRGGLFADCTRTFCVGPAPPDVVEAHQLVRQALERSVEQARPGVHAPALQSAVCDLFESSSWATPRSSPGTIHGYVHGLGHGVGFELHEQPAFRGEGPGSHLEVGDVFTLEPGLYDPDAGFGIRLEDLLWLDDDGPVNLTPLPYDLDPTLW